MSGNTDDCGAKHMPDPAEIRRHKLAFLILRYLHIVDDDDKNHTKRRGNRKIDQLGNTKYVRSTCGVAVKKGRVGAKYWEWSK